MLVEECLFGNSPPNGIMPFSIEIAKEICELTGAITRLPSVAAGPSSSLRDAALQQGEEDDSGAGLIGGKEVASVSECSAVHLNPGRPSDSAGGIGALTVAMRLETQVRFFLLGDFEGIPKFITDCLCIRASDQVCAASIGALSNCIEFSFFSKTAAMPSQVTMPNMPNRIACNGFIELASDAWSWSPQYAADLMRKLLSSNSYGVVKALARALTHDPARAQSTGVPNLLITCFLVGDSKAIEMLRTEFDWQKLLQCFCPRMKIRFEKAKAKVLDPFRALQVDEATISAIKDGDSNPVSAAGSARNSPSGSACAGEAPPTPSSHSSSSCRGIPDGDSFGADMGLREDIEDRLTDLGDLVRLAHVISKRSGAQKHMPPSQRDHHSNICRTHSSHAKHWKAIRLKLINIMTRALLHDSPQVRGAVRSGVINMIEAHADITTTDLIHSVAKYLTLQFEDDAFGKFWDHIHSAPAAQVTNSPGEAVCFDPDLLKQLQQRAHTSRHDALHPFTPTITEESETECDPSLEGDDDGPDVVDPKTPSTAPVSAWFTRPTDAWAPRENGRD